MGTNRKPVCDFLLVNNTNLHLISHRFPVTSSGQIIVFDKGCILLMHSFLVISANIARSHTLVKSDS